MGALIDMRSLHTRLFVVLVLLCSYACAIDEPPSVENDGEHVDATDEGDHSMTDEGDHSVKDEGDHSIKDEGDHSVEDDGDHTTEDGEHVDHHSTNPAQDGKDEMERIDTNKDGKVTLQELEKAYAEGGSTPEQAAKEASDYIEHMDANKDKTLTLEEIVKHYEALPAADPTEHAHEDL